MNSGAARKHIVTQRDSIPRIVEEFWTSKQRQASSLHEISYRACFKPQLPRYFIERYSNETDLVYDPFMGRGTTLIEAALLNRNVIGNDVNPLSRMLTEPRLNIPTTEEVATRIGGIRFSPTAKADIDLSMFFHRRTEAEIVSLQRYLVRGKHEGTEDNVDRWIRMVATNRLTGHSTGFFSVYTLPPNQATRPENQRRINRLRKQKPEYRDIRLNINKKTRSLLRNISEEQRTTVNTIGDDARFFSSDAGKTSRIKDGSVALTVTSPPFLNIVHYSHDNWLRCWFNGIDETEIENKITMSTSIGDWSLRMGEVFTELYRITRKGGMVAFEVGEVRRGTVKLEEHVIPLGEKAGFQCTGILINTQRFTKTSNIWGIDNNSLGTNTNRIVQFKKPD